MRRRTTIVGSVRYTTCLSGNGQEDSAPEDSRGILVGGSPWTQHKLSPLGGCVRPVGIGECLMPKCKRDLLVGKDGLDDLHRRQWRRGCRCNSLEHFLIRGDLQSGKTSDRKLPAFNSQVV